MLHLAVVKRKRTMFGHTYLPPAVLTLSSFANSINLLLLLVASISFGSASAQPWRLETWSHPFDYNSESRIIEYQPATPATRPWHLCISYPHLKDSYWLNVNYGMVEEARRLGVRFTLLEAGGYPNVERQRQQITQCAENGADALIVGTVAYKDLSDTVVDIARAMPVLSTVNDIDDAGITAKSGVSWTTMGRVAGEYLAERHPSGSQPVNVAWFPGPQGAGWVEFIERGFMSGVASSAIDVVVTKWGDTGKEIQRTLVQEVLESHPDVDYIVGNALMTEAAISTLRNRGLENKINIVSTYFTPSVYRGIRRGRILAAPTDAPVVQGRISINQAVQILEKRDFNPHLGPEIKLIHQDNWKDIDIAESLAPATFLPAFTWP